MRWKDKKKLFQKNKIVKTMRALQRANKKKQENIIVIKILFIVRRLVEFYVKKNFIARVCLIMY